MVGQRCRPACSRRPGDRYRRQDRRPDDRRSRRRPQHERTGAVPDGPGQRRGMQVDGWPGGAGATGHAEVGSATGVCSRPGPTTGATGGPVGPLAGSGVLPRAGHAASSRCGPLHGMVTWMRQPGRSPRCGPPGSRTPIRPPCSSTTQRAMARPSPVPPSAARSPRVNRSNTRERSAGGMPWPSSLTSKQSWSPCSLGAHPHRAAGWAVPRRVVEQVREDLVQPPRVRATVSGAGRSRSWKSHVQPAPDALAVACSTASSRKSRARRCGRAAAAPPRRRVGTGRAGRRRGGRAVRSGRAPTQRRGFGRRPPRRPCSPARPATR